MLQAHAHARSAARETENAQWDGAISEHQQAASGFARAARDTGDYEVGDMGTRRLRIQTDGR